MNKVKQWVLQWNKWKVVTMVLIVALSAVVPWGLVKSQALKSYREVLNDIHDRVNHRLMTEPWAGGLATAQGQMWTETEIWNDVYDDANHRLNVSGAGGGGSGAFADITGGTNTSAAMVVGTNASLATSGSGTISATTALTAGALATNPIPCAVNGFVIDIAADGTLSCAQPAFSNLSGAATDAQIPNLNTLGTGLTGSRCVETDAGGLLSVAAGVCGSGGGSSAFNAITGGTNTTAAMVVGTGASLGVSGSGTIAATTAVAASGNPTDCIAGSLAAGVDANFVAEGCTDVATQAELDTHAALTNGHSATAANTANRIVLRGAAGEFAAGAITGSLVGNADTSTQLAVNGTNCAAGSAAGGVDAFGVAEDCTGYAVASVPVLTSTAVAGLSGEVNLGALSTGILRHGVSAGVSTPAASELSGDVTTTGSNAVTIAANAVTFAKMQNVATDTFIGRDTAGTGNIEEMSVGTVRTLLNISNVDNTSDATKNSAVKTLTNTEIVPRRLDQADASPITIDCSLYDSVRIDELSQATTFNAPTGCTPEDEQRITIVVFSTVARALTFSTGTAAFSAGYGLALPTTTYAGQWVKYGFHWNEVLAKWVFDGSTQTTTYGVNNQCFTSNGPGVEPSFRACPAGGGGTTGYIHLPVGSVGFPTTNPAILDGSESNIRLLFDQTTKQCAYWGPFRMNSDYASAPVFKVQHSMTSVTGAFGVVFGVYVMAVTSGDAVDAVTDSYGTVNLCTNAVIPATAGYMEEISCALTNNDSLAAGDLTKIQICREVAEAADNALGTAEVLDAAMEYTK